MSTGATFSCSMAGYVGMVQEIISTALFAVTMLESTVYWIISGLPSIARAWQLSFEFLTGAADWIGYLIAAVYYIGIDLGYAGTLCDISQYGYYVIYYLNLVVSFGSSM